jgi:hypothetical protein
MPVQVASGPAPQRRCQVAQAGAPPKRQCKKKQAAPVGEIGEVQKQADTYSGRLKVTSWAFVVIGAVGVGTAVAHGIGARHAAERDLAGPPHHQRGGPHGGPPPHGRHGEDGQRQGGHHQGPHHQGPPPPRSENISRDEFAVMENLRVMAFLALLASCALVRTGYKALRALKTQTAGFTGCVFRMSTFRLAWVLLFALMIHGFGENTRHIIEDHQSRQGQG